MPVASPLLDILSLGEGRHVVRKLDLVDAYASVVREVDPEMYVHVGGPLATVAEAPDHSGYDAWESGYRRLGNDMLVPNGYPTIERIIREQKEPFKELLRGLRIDEDNIAIPVGFEEIALFAVMQFTPEPGVFAGNTVATLDVYGSGYNASLTTSWTKPTGSGLRFVSIRLIGGGGGGGSGSKVTTSGNQAAGGGGGGGGGYIGRFVTLASQSTGNVVVGGTAAGVAGSSVANTNGTIGPAGVNTTFGGLTAGGGGAGGAGAQGAGAQTGALGAGGTGDIAGAAGGTGRSGATAGDNGVDATTGPGGAGGGGGGGGTADTAQGAGGRGGRGWHNNGLHGTVGGGTLGAAGGSAGGTAAIGRGEGSGGGGGSDASAVAGGAGGQMGDTAHSQGSGGGGGGGRARNAATNTGNGGASQASGSGIAILIAF